MTTFHSIYYNTTLKKKQEMQL